MRHAAAADDPALVGRILMDAGGLRLWLHQGVDRLVEADQQLTEDAIAKHPRLALVRCAALALTGRLAEARRRLEDVGAAGPTTDPASARPRPAGMHCRRPRPWRAARDTDGLQGTPGGQVLRSLVNGREGLSVPVAGTAHPMDNNFAERLPRRPVIGRRLSFGSDSETGARFTALMYSVVERDLVARNRIDVLLRSCVRRAKWRPASPNLIAAAPAPAVTTMRPLARLADTRNRAANRRRARDWPSSQPVPLNHNRAVQGVLPPHRLVPGRRRSRT